jgi:hypothetical protein
MKWTAVTQHFSGIRTQKICSGLWLCFCNLLFEAINSGPGAISLLSLFSATETILAGNQTKDSVQGSKLFVPIISSSKQNNFGLGAVHQESNSEESCSGLCPSFPHYPLRDKQCWSRHHFSITLYFPAAGIAVTGKYKQNAFSEQIFAPYVLFLVSRNKQAKSGAHRRIRSRDIGEPTNTSAK